ncbi:RICIN domain-containing protein [Myceligenerans xiligouense]|uniref:Glycosyl hydrolase family 43 n=1 Tax=Myceligenerans xiligouense TaxID=253184 RepID=A0A3N4YRF3_9MICO|nr:RICIN domain-containing protein [Myceligenerans xiligouense]RPF22717.1 glycosyl hydrolase family 43 [Myceligenerans xiligouense]
MRRIYGVLAALSCAVASTLAFGLPARADEVTVPNATQFTTTGGSPVHAHGGGVVKSGSYYYWIGEHRQPDDNGFRYVSCYRSTDLADWEFVNNVLTQASDPELQQANIERPKIMYNPATDRYVIWAHKENGVDYGEARAAVAVSTTNQPCGSYDYRGSFRPLGHMSRDIGVFVDDDGTGYMYSSARENYDLHIYRLTADFAGIDELVADPWHGGHREAPALFKRGDTYFMLTSGATGWSPNQQQYATAPSVTGPWTAMRNVGDPTMYGSQTAFVLPIQGSQGTDYLYMGDRWGNSFGGIVNDSRYVWAPIEFPTSTTMEVDYFAELAIDTDAGTVTGQGGPFRTLEPRHASTCADVTNNNVRAGEQLKTYTCNGQGNQRFWFRDAGGGHFTIVAQHSNMCLQENASTVTQESCDGGTDQQWRSESAGTYLRILARNSGECLDVSGGGTGQGAQIITYACNGQSNQQWARG